MGRRKLLFCLQSIWKEIMECEYISASRADLYEACALRYHARYKLRVRGQGSDALDTGLFVHKCLEEFYDPEHDRSVDECIEIAKKEHEVTSFEGFQESIDMFHGVVTKYPKDMFIVIDTEIEADLTFPSGLRIFGRIDRIDYIDDVTVRVLDYKTGKYTATFDEIQSGHQSNLYALWIFNTPEFDGIEVVEFAIHYTRDNIIKPVTITREESEKYKEYLEFLYEQILRNENPQPRLNNFCWNCEYRGECPLYKNFVNAMLNDKEFFEDVDMDNIKVEDVVNASQKLGVATSILKNEKQVLDSWIISMIQSRDIKSVDGEEYTASLTTKKYVKNDFDVVKRVAEDRRVNLKKVFKVDNGSVSKTFAKDSEALNIIESAAKVDHGNPYITMKKRKEVK